MAANGNHYVGVEVTHKVSGLTFVTFNGYLVDEDRLDEHDFDDAYLSRSPSLVGTWVYDAGVEPLAATEVLH